MPPKHPPWNSTQQFHARATKGSQRRHGLPTDGRFHAHQLRLRSPAALVLGGEAERQQQVVQEHCRDSQTRALRGGRLRRTFAGIEVRPRVAGCSFLSLTCAVPGETATQTQHCRNASAKKCLAEDLVGHTNIILVLNPSRDKWCIRTDVLTDGSPT